MNELSYFLQIFLLLKKFWFYFKIDAAHFCTLIIEEVRANFENLVRNDASFKSSSNEILYRFYVFNCCFSNIFSISKLLL